MNPPFPLTVAEDQTPERVDRYLSSHLEGVSRAYLDTFFRSEKILIDGHPAKKSQLITPSQKIDIRDFVHPSELSLEANAHIDCEVLHEHEDFVIISKPPGIPSHANRYTDRHTISNWALAQFPRLLEEADDPLRPGIVHRLDTDTSGCLIVAKNKTAYRRLRKLFTKRVVFKEYTAVLLGTFPFDSRSVNVPVANHPKNVRKMLAVLNERDAKRLQARDAFSHFHCEERCKDYSIVKVKIETGRTHQIRVHAAYLGHPVSGDQLYRQGGDRHRDRLNPPRQLLHATTIAFTYQGEEISAQAPFPNDFKTALTQLRT